MNSPGGCYTRCVPLCGDGMRSGVVRPVGLERAWLWIWLGEGVDEWHSGHSLMQPCTAACSGKEAEGEARFDACAASRATAWFESLRQQHADSSMRQRCRRAVMSTVEQRGIGSRPAATVTAARSPSLPPTSGSSKNIRRLCHVVV
jgi:hypothetical protein